jgi:hypothetical protein
MMKTLVYTKSEYPLCTTNNSVQFSLALSQPSYHIFQREEDGYAHRKKVGDVDGVLLVVGKVEEGEERGVEECLLAVGEGGLAGGEGLRQAAGGQLGGALHRLRHTRLNLLPDLLPWVKKTEFKKVLTNEKRGGLTVVLFDSSPSPGNFSATCSI